MSGEDYQGFSINASLLALVLCLLFWIAKSVAAETMSPAELEEWFQQDEVSSPAEAINEGELRFLIEPPAKPALHSLNVLTVYPTSLDDGWIALSQCYQNLDPVMESEVIYRYKSMRDLNIVKFKNIGEVQIVGQSIQLTDVRKAAELCVSAMVRIFYLNPDGSYSLVNGPFHRRFLDGYFPYQLTMEVDYPVEMLRVKQTTPAAQPGFRVEVESGRVVMKGIFEGILNIEIVFQTR